MLTDFAYTERKQMVTKFRFTDLQSILHLVASTFVNIIHAWVHGGIRS